MDSAPSVAVAEMSSGSDGTRLTGAGRQSDTLRVDVLGPIRVSDAAGRDVTPEGALQRRLLALLVLHRGHVVSVEAAIDALWPARSPRDPVAAVQNHVFRLRRGLPVDAIESTDTGYRLAASRIDLDADRLVATLAAPEADPAVLATIDGVLERWQGPAYPELDDADDGRAEAARLGELRIRAVERRAEWRLAAGVTDALVGELTALVDEEPLRERPRALLMAALAQGGRTAEALRVYDDFRRRLGDELGIEPSPALAAQHAELLAGTDVGVWKPASRLPVPVTSLVGREALVEEVVAMAEVHRLVTLIGPGGVGKTRLLGEIGLRLRAARPDRPVVMCELATATEESAVDAVAEALGIEGRPGVGLADRVAAALADTEIVVLLDNCEHVLDPIAALVELLLARCRNATVVTTSRERLRVPAERLCPVPALSSADDDAPAVRLFVERARAVAPAFEPDRGEVSVVGEIVRRLDGLPLAIELAAARLHTLDVEEVAAGLDRRFDLLSSGYRTSSRHGSLHAAVSWSFELLDAPLRRAFVDLSLFAGPFTAGDAAAICGFDADTITAALDQLVERSLVMRAPDRRYVMLETLRAFGAEQLVADGRADATAERHARHHVEWIEAADRRLVEPGPHATMTEIDGALPELRTALAWLLDQDEIELAGRLVAALLDYGFLRLRPDVLAWSERVAAADPDGRSPLAPLVLAVSGYGAWMAGDVAEAGARAACARRLADRPGGVVPAEVATLSGSYALFEGRLDEAARWYHRARGAAGDDRAQRLVAAGAEVLALAYAGTAAAVDAAADLLTEVGEAATVYAAYAWYCAGEADLSVDVDRARVRLDRALELAEVTQASFVAGVAGASRASIDARLGDPEAAATDYRRLITHWRRAGMWSTQWTMLRSVAGLLARLGRARDAALLLGAVRSTQAGHRIFGADAAVLTELGTRLHATLGDDAYQAALREGSELDGDAAVELALRALSANSTNGANRGSSCP
jgi:predicted ATPase/DNA-binding SARP family transcriptional activator